MQLDARKPVVVLLGAWNPQIFHPSWVSLHIFGEPEGKNVDFRVLQSLPDGKQIFYMSEHNVGYYADPTRLEFYLNNYDDVSIDFLCSIVSKVIQTLPHTPFGDFGVNFNFVEKNIPADAIDKLQSNDGIDEVYRVGSQEFLARILYAERCQLNFKRLITDTGGFFDFNYHHSVTGLGDMEKITGEYVRGLLADSKAKLNGIYDVSGDDVISHTFN